MTRLIDADRLKAHVKMQTDLLRSFSSISELGELATVMADGFEREVDIQPTVDAVPVPVGGIGELSDGYHTFNGLYYQRMMLFAVLVKTYKDRSWKSRRHSDGEPCFGGGWFIVGIDTPQGSYTYHYEDKYFDMFDCIELSKGKEWDGHTEDDVTRLLSLDVEPVRHGRWKTAERDGVLVYSDAYRQCSECNDVIYLAFKMQYCPTCGARMDGEYETD